MFGLVSSRNTPRLCSVFCSLLFAICSFAHAHAVAVNLDAFVEQSELVVLMNGADGQPINQASIAYSLLSQKGEVSSAQLKYVADGEYRTTLPTIPNGQYTLKLRDTTFPQEALEVASTIQMPLQNPVRLLLPPSKAGQPDVTILIVLAVLPIVVALGALVLVLFLRPKPKPEVVE
jgi:hypothetical protein